MASKTESLRAAKRRAREVEREQRLASRQRRRAERKEYKRFTAASRARRLTWTAGIGGIVAVAVTTVVLTTSPLLSLETIRVEGVERLGSDEVIAELQGFAGVPLARIQTSEVVDAVSNIALIQSVDTDLQLPNTLVVRVTERTPIGVVRGGAGFEVVDRAAVVLWESETRPAEFPLIMVPASTESRGFEEIGRALAVIPPDLLRDIDRVTASSADTVAFSVRGSDHRVLWGSSENSVAKARVLPAALDAAGTASPQLIDLSSPDTVVVRDVTSPLPVPPALEEPENVEGDTP